MQAAHPAVDVQRKMNSMLNGNFRGFLSHNILSGHLFLLQVLCIFVMAFSAVFLWDSWECEVVCLCVCVSCIFLRLFSSVCLMFSPILNCSFSFHYILIRNHVF